MDDLVPLTYREWLGDLLMAALAAGAVCLLIGLLLGYHLRRPQMSHETDKPTRRGHRARREHRRAIEQLHADLDAFEKGVGHG